MSESLRYLGKKKVYYVLFCLEDPKTFTEILNKVEHDTERHFNHTALSGFLRQGIEMNIITKDLDGKYCLNTYGKQILGKLQEICEITFNAEQVLK